MSPVGSLLRRTALFTCLTLALMAPASAQEAGSALQGIVIDENGEPVRNAAVLLLGTELVTTSDTEGVFVFEVVEPGEYTVEARLPGYTIASLQVRFEGEPIAGLELRLITAETPLDEILVTASHTILREEPTSTVGLGRQEIEKLPHFGDDLYRALTILPGTSGGGFSAAFNVRGGFHEEMLATIDGQEVIEPFHLKDFQGVFSILDPQIITSVDLVPGGFPVERGDRMTAVLDMRTRRPDQSRTSLGASFSNLWAGSSGTFADGKGRWLASGRYGFLELVLALAGDDEEEEGDEDPAPRYWDLFGKLDYDLTPSQTLSLHALAAEDTIDFEEVEPDDRAEVETAYGNRYLWATHQALLSDRVFVNTLASLGHLDHDRLADLEEFTPPEFIKVFDVRDTDVFTLRQDWGAEIGDRHYLKWGFEARSWDATYDYRNDVAILDVIDDPRFLPGDRVVEFADDYSSEQYALYLADRMRLGSSLTAELGVRWDKQTLTEEDYVSPRVNLVYDLGGGGVLRAGWGHFYQSHRPYELDVQFAETEFQPAARAEHWILGYENLLGEYRVRADLFHRDVTDAQIRYETLFDPFNIFPEGRTDLVAIPAESATADGVELSLRAPFRDRLNWWLSYSWSSVEDEVEGKSIRRSIDQTHAITASLGWRPSRKWSLTWVWFYHTGWPTTPVDAEVVLPPDDIPFIEYDVGEFYTERWDAYHRLDFRASRTTSVGKDGFLTFFIDIQNLYNRDNQRGIEIGDPEYELLPDGTIGVTFPREDWLPILPSFGVIWEF